MSLKIHVKLSIAVLVYVLNVKCGNSTIQHKYKNCYFFEKSSGIMYLALAVAPATWYNGFIKIQVRKVTKKRK